MAVRIALGQAEAAAGKIADNLLRAAGLADAAGAAGARMLVLPELFACGYDPAAIASDADSWVLPLPPAGRAPDDSSPLAPLTQACSREGIAVLLGAAVPGLPGGRPYNSVVAIDTRGRVRGSYAKAHLWGPEQQAFAPGDALVVAELGGLAFGVGICYDAGFPEFGRAYARAGADALVFSSAFAAGATQPRYRIYHPARAVENTVYTVVANAIGEVAGERYFGCSGAWGPTGDQLTTTGAEPGITAVDIDPLAIAAARKRLPYLAELRTDLLPARPTASPHRIILDA
ncbi:carbon-nitrogen hydrolase family protein [Saccharopolyspora phatthalungensis]|uniref:Putative amidohydrolase n=1 Tax=Saccharopolyspora phatthalungensis TaxID=664693 RepID=A0A840Q721_9PSEU|nr:carbon-nitrogen hydrolase family protein [Saccharopolyspora phatthalungensis]MBB5158302.1 putative amidohydrolase [Saccharopolyspora phatthalungensis]